MADRKEIVTALDELWQGFADTLRLRHEYDQNDDAVMEVIHERDIELLRNVSILLEEQEAVKDALDLLKEQKKGKWIDHTFAHGDDIECPFCHKKWNVIDNCTETFDYCPGCGAKLS